MMGSRLALSITELGGSALLLALGYWWLGVGESDASHLLLSGFTVLAILAGAAWLQGLALACFCGFSYLQAAVRAARNLPALLAVLLLTLAVYGLLHSVSLHYGHTAFLIGSYATMATRKPVAPTSVALAFKIVIAIFQWALVPMLLFPLAAAVAVRGWRGWRFGALRRRRKWLYAVEVAVLLLCAIWIPFRLFFWIPKIESFGGQMGSLVLRMGAGYLLFVGGVLAIEFFTSTGSPCATQPSTVPSP